MKAAEEDLVEVRGRDAAAFARIAWHLGNRHLPTQIDHDRLLIRDDHVIVDMLKGLGAEVRKVRVPFDPEGGAYGQHNHDTGHRHGELHPERQRLRIRFTGCWPGCRRPIRSVPSATATVSRPPSKKASSRIGRR